MLRTVLAKNRLAAGVGGVTVSAAMKTISAKAKISGLTLIGILMLVMVAETAPHDWVLKTGETITGDYVSSGTTTLVLKTGGTNCFLNISDLSTNDQTTSQKCRLSNDKRGWTRKQNKWHKPV